MEMIQIYKSNKVAKTNMFAKIDGKFQLQGNVIQRKRSRDNKNPSFYKCYML